MKKLMYFIALITLLFSATSCSNREVNEDNSEAFIGLSQSNENNGGSEKSDSEQLPPISQDIYLQAMEKWVALGGNIDFKNIDNIDTETLVKIYSHYGVYIGAFTYNAYWMDTDEFDCFVKDYFDLTPEQFHQSYQGFPQENYDTEKGFRFYPRTSILPDNATHEMISFGDNEDGTHYFEYKTTFELSKELVPEGESTIERITNVTFRYVDKMIYFVKAFYEQDGKVL